MQEPSYSTTVEYDAGYTTNDSDGIVTMEHDGYTVVYVESDGNCFFRAVSRQIWGDVYHHATLRKIVCHELLSNKALYEAFISDSEGTYEEYVDNMTKLTVWGGELEIAAVERLLMRPVEIWENGTPNKRASSYEGEPIRLTYQGKFHYNALVQEDETSSVCYVMGKSGRLVPEPELEHMDGGEEYNIEQMEIVHCDACGLQCCWVYRENGHAVCWACRDPEQEMRLNTPLAELDNYNLLLRALELIDSMHKGKHNYDCHLKDECPYWEERDPIDCVSGFQPDPGQLERFFDAFTTKLVPVASELRSRLTEHNEEDSDDAEV